MFRFFIFLYSISRITMRIYSDVLLSPSDSLVKKNYNHLAIETQVDCQPHPDFLTIYLLLKLAGFLFFDRALIEQSSADKTKYNIDNDVMM